MPPGRYSSIPRDQLWLQVDEGQLTDRVGSLERVTFLAELRCQRTPSSLATDSNEAQSEPNAELSKFFDYLAVFLGFSL